MKRILLFAIAMSLISAVYTTAQESYFQQNDNVVNLGIGVGGSYYGYYGYTGYHRLPTFALGYERCVLGHLFNEQSALGVGGLAGVTYANHSSWTSTDVMVGVRGAMHYAFVEKLDVYAGVMLGFNIHSWKWKGVSESVHSGNSGLGYGVFAGARYYFAGPVAAFAELGYGFTLLNAGLSIKF